MKKQWICLFAVLLAVMLSACGAGSGQLTPEMQTELPVHKLKVVTTLFPYYDFIRQVAGEDVELTLVVPAGMDSHSFEPTPADMLTIQHADVLICNGGAMEQWLTDVLDALDTSDMTIVTMMDYVDVFEEEMVEGMEEEAHDHADHDHSADELHADHDHADRAGEPYDEFEYEIEYDEHIWTSPVNAMTLVQVIADRLAQRDVVHSAGYQERARDYIGKLQEIHEELLQVMAQRKRDLIVVADKFPFRYLAETYDLRYRAAFVGCSSDTEPSAKTIAYLIDKVRDEQMPVVYYLELSTHRVAEIIAEETGAEPLLLHSCHNVTRREFEAGVTYEELMRGNVESLRKGLCE